MNNFIMNVAAIAKHLRVVPEVIVYAWLVTADMPFELLIGPTPNAIACDSRQFSPCELFKDSGSHEHHPARTAWAGHDDPLPMLDMPIWSINKSV